MGARPVRTLHHSTRERHEADTEPLPAEHVSSAAGCGRHLPRHQAGRSRHQQRATDEEDKLPALRAPADPPRRPWHRRVQHRGSCRPAPRSHAASDPSHGLANRRRPISATTQERSDLSSS
jgi:hypothetical protein